MFYSIPGSAHISLLGIIAVVLPMPVQDMRQTHKDTHFIRSIKQTNISFSFLSSFGRKASRVGLWSVHPSIETSHDMGVVTAEL